MAEIARPYDVICDAVLRSRAQHSSAGVATEVVKALEAAGWGFVHRTRGRERVDYAVETETAPASEAQPISGEAQS